MAAHQGYHLVACDQLAAVVCPWSGQYPNLAALGRLASDRLFWPLRGACLAKQYKPLAGTAAVMASSGIEAVRHPPPPPRGGARSLSKCLQPGSQSA